MKKLLAILPFFLLSITLFAQKQVVIVDSVNLNPLTFAIVEYNEEGFYTREDGTFIIPPSLKDSLTIHLLGYEPKKFHISEIKDSIYLNPQNTILNPVIVNANKKVLDIPQDKRARDFASQPINPEKSIYSILKPKEISQDLAIQEISFQFQKALGFQRRKRLRSLEVQALIRIHIYNVKDGQLDKAIYNSDILYIDPANNESIQLELTEDNLFFEATGIGVEIEFIKFEAPSDLEDLVSYIRPILVDEKNKTNPYYEAKTFLRNTLNKDNSKWRRPINEIYNNDQTQHKKEYKRTLGIGLKLK